MYHHWPQVRSARLYVRQVTRTRYCSIHLLNRETLRRDGSLQFRIKSRCNERIDFYCSIDRAHSCDVNAVDETSKAIISGSGDGTVKVAFLIVKYHGECAAYFLIYDTKRCKYLDLGTCWTENFKFTFSNYKHCR